MRSVFCWYRLPLLKKFDYVKQCFQELFIPGISLNIFLIFCRVADSLHNPMDFIKASIEDVSTVPAYFPERDSSIASIVSALG